MANARVGCGHAVYLLLILRISERNFLSLVKWTVLKQWILGGARLS